VPSTVDQNKETLREELTLQLLSDIDGGGPVSQRSMAMNLGVAVGLANTLLKRCVRKGWVKMHQVPARRYAYYLTPQGFAEKSRLTASYLAASFSFFRRARSQCGALLDAAAERGWRRIVLVGDGDLAEIVVLSAHEATVELVAVLVPGANKERVVGLPVVARFADLPPYDALLLTDIRAPQERYDELRARVDPARILVPPLLRVTRERPNGEGTQP
jgi:DNA-binding MarR family transcriptional regulator